MAKSSEKTVRRGNRRLSGKHGLLVVFCVIAVLAIGLFFADAITSNLSVPTERMLIGATFSKPYAESLGLDWKAVYTAVLDELKVQRLRIPAYWDNIEPEPGVYNFADVDWQVEQAAEHGAQVVLAVGRKLPRWPECHVPAWATGMDENLLRARILAMVEKSVRHFADYPNIIMWQVENEPFFPFGDCPDPDRALLKQEVQVVHSLDNRPVMVTESGELSTWINAASLGDVLGISAYRVVWDKRLGYLYWPITPATYRGRAAAIRGFVDDIIISELQAEPWVPGGIEKMPVDEQLRLLSPQRLRDNVDFARRIGFSSAYFWGVEWWYWLKTVKGHPEIWEDAKEIIHGGEVYPANPGSSAGLPVMRQ